MGATSVTRSYTSVIALTLDKVREAVEDQITKNNKYLFFIRRSGNWQGVASLGDRLRVPLMYELAPADSYSGFGQIDTTPADGITDAFFDWRQAAATISLSGLDEAMNSGPEGVVSILKARTKQAVLGLEDFFSKGILQGQGSVSASTTNLATAYVSPINGSTFIDPLGLIVKADPTSSTSIGAINQSTNTWWQNKYQDSGASTFAGFLIELRNIFNQASKGGGGAKGQPDFNLCDQNTYELYESALAAAHRNPDYKLGDIPFETVAFKGRPVVWDENVPDIKNGDLTVGSTTDAGTWYTLNSNFLGVTFHNDHNFTIGEFIKPENQDARTAKVLWYGTHWTSQRRKQGVLFGISTSIAA